MCTRLGDEAVVLDEGFHWSIWSMKVSLKCSVLVCLSYHNALPTNHHWRGMASSSVWTACNIVDESIVHYLRDCSQARRIWSLMQFDVSTPAFRVQEARVWLHQILARSLPVACATLW